MTALDIRPGDKLRCVEAPCPDTVTVRRIEAGLIFVEGQWGSYIAYGRIHTDPDRTDGWLLLPRGGE